MKIFYSLFCLVFFKVATARVVPISDYTYENYKKIDDYYGETDSLLLRFNIQTVKVYSESDTVVLYRVENYRQGKKTKVQEFDSWSGKPDRTIQYTYKDSVLKAELIHYPSSTNFNMVPDDKHHYLRQWVNSNTTRSLYKRDDTVTNIIRMHIQYIWRHDGSILFKSFNRDGELIETHVMKPKFTWEEYQRRVRTKYPHAIEDEHEEYKYDEKGRLVFYKNKEFERQRIYTYDERGLLEKMEIFVKGKRTWANTYQYE